MTGVNATSWLISKPFFIFVCFQIETEYTFLDFILGGCQINFTVRKDGDIVFFLRLSKVFVSP